MFVRLSPKARVRDLVGFGVRVHATGRKIYVVQKRRRGGSPKRVSLGSCEDITVEKARREAAEVIDRLKRGAPAFPAPSWRRMARSA